MALENWYLYSIGRSLISLTLTIDNTFSNSSLLISPLWILEGKNFIASFKTFIDNFVETNASSTPSPSVSFAKPEIISSKIVLFSTTSPFWKWEETDIVNFNVPFLLFFSETLYL
ncbi:MAG: hypothetical protein ACRCRZ_02430 [Metamycoplasmataceae bacterium]